MKKSRIKNLASWALSVAMIAAGAALIASFYFASNLESIASNGAGSGGFNVPSLDTDRPIGPEIEAVAGLIESGEIDRAGGWKPNG